MYHLPNATIAQPLTLAAWATWVCMQEGKPTVSSRRASVCATIASVLLEMLTIGRKQSARNVR